MNFYPYDVLNEPWKEVDQVEYAEIEPKDPDTPKRPKVARKRATKVTNVCRGPGCNCGQSFKSREELQSHYLEKLCFTCKECDTAFPSKIMLREHFQSAHTGNLRKKLITVRIRKFGHSVELLALFLYLLYEYNNIVFFLNNCPKVRVKSPIFQFWLYFKTWLWPSKKKDRLTNAGGRTVKSHLIKLGIETCMNNQLVITFVALAEFSLWNNLSWMITTRLNLSAKKNTTELY